jgi:hypothetical protein
VSLTITLEAQRLKCLACENLYDGEPDEDLERLPFAYECDNCGDIFSEQDSGAYHVMGGAKKNQCPSCNRFARKSDDRRVCEHCGDAAEFEEVYVITCVCHDDEHEIYY